MIMSDTTFTIWESRLAGRLGVSRETLAALRKRGAVRQGEDWDFCAGRVCYAERSVSRITQHLELEWADRVQTPTESQSSPETSQDASDESRGSEDPSDAANAPQRAPQRADDLIKSASAEEVLTVASRPNRRFNGAHYINPKLILARRADGHEVIVRVRDSSRFAPTARNGQPMKVRAYPDGYGGWVACSGPI